MIFNRNKIVLGTILLFVIGGIAVAMYWFWRLGFFSSEVKQTVDIEEKKNITDETKVTRKGKLDEDHLTKIQFEKRPDGTIKENITIHDVKHAENLIKLEHARHENEMIKYKWILSCTVGPFCGIILAILVAWFCVSRRSQRQGHMQARGEDPDEIQRRIREILKEIE